LADELITNHLAKDFYMTAFTSKIAGISFWDKKSENLPKDLRL